MECRYIDTHSHVHFAQYDDLPTGQAGREELFARMRGECVATIAIGTDLETSKEALGMAQKYPDVVLGATIGVHPNDTDEVFDEDIFEKLLQGEARPRCLRVVAVGECGLDYFRRPSVVLTKEEESASGPSSHEATHASPKATQGTAKGKQRENFEKQIDFALKHDLPLMLHVRPSAGTQDAHEDALEILEDYKRGGKASLLRGTAHFFTGSVDVARRYWDLGLCTSFPGVITFAKDTHDAVREAPLDMILSETDAPYAAPVPYRGKRNEPAYVIEVVKEIARIKEMDFEVVRKQLVENAVRVFGLGTKYLS